MNTPIVSIFCLFSILLFNFSWSKAEYEIIPVGKTHNKEFFTGPIRYEWLESFDACKYLGLEFGGVETREENEIVSNFLKYQRLIPEYDANFWIAATDFFQEGSFSWMKNQKPLSFFNWKKSIKNDVTRNCVVIGSDGKWKFWPCHSGQELALCQKYTGKIHLNESEILGRYKNNKMITRLGQIDNKIYFMDKEDRGLLFTEALNFCHENSLNLASFRNEEEQRFILNISSQLKTKDKASNAIIWGSGANFFAKDEEKDFYWLEDGSDIKETDFLKLSSDGDRNRCIAVFPNADQIQTTDCALNNRRTVCELHF